MFTALEWVVQLLGQLGESPDRPFDRVIMIRIQPFPAEHAQAAKKYAGWLYGLVGPLETLEAVRTASQTERNNLGAQMISRAVKAEAAEAAQQMTAMDSRTALDNVPEPVRNQMMKLAQKSDVEVLVVNPFRYADPDGEREPTIPLSWKLTHRQQDKIRRAWKNLEGKAGDQDNPFTTLDGYFKKRIGN
jgi:hypothetical protein